MSDKEKLWGKTCTIHREVGDKMMVEVVTEEVLVHVISVKHVDAYLASIGDERALIKHAVRGATDDWIDSLLPESFDLLAQATNEVNTIPLFGSRRRQMERLEMVIPGVTQRFETSLAQVSRSFLAGLPSSSGSASTPSVDGLTPTSAPSPTPSGSSEPAASSISTTPP